MGRAIGRMRLHIDWLGVESGSKAAGIQKIKVLYSNPFTNTR